MLKHERKVYVDSTLVSTNSHRMPSSKLFKYEICQETNFKFVVQLKNLQPIFGLHKIHVTWKSLTSSLQSFLIKYMKMFVCHGISPYKTFPEMSELVKQL